MTNTLLREQASENIEIADIVKKDTAYALLGDDDISYWIEIQQNKITSPAEQLFFLQWYVYADSHIKDLLIPQYKIANYRVDFCVNLIDHFVNSLMYPTNWLEKLNKILSPTVVIEIDGFAYHEAIPERAEKDKIRDRRLTQAGFQVHRFAAREVFSRPVECFEEIWKPAQQKLDSLHCETTRIVREILSRNLVSN